MGTEITPPKRGQPIVMEDSSPTLRAIKFFVAIRDWIAAAPDVMTNIADVSTGSADADIIALEDKINDILAELQSSGVMS